MKRFIALFTICFCVSILSISAQAKLDSNLVAKIEKTIPKKEKRLIKDLATGELSHAVMVVYSLDEYRIDEYFKRKVYNDNSDYTYIAQLILAEKRYQVILTKYYNALSALLKPSDQDILDEAQARWQAYKRYEREVNKMINPESYQMKRVPIESLAQRQLDITKYRVLEIVDYIARLQE